MSGGPKKESLLRLEDFFTEKRGNKIYRHLRSAVLDIQNGVNLHDID
jgi:hypothetical protein